MNFRQFLNHRFDKFITEDSSNNEFLTENLSETQTVTLQSEYDSFCDVLRETNYLTESVHVSEGMKDKIAFVRKLADTLTVGIKKLSKLFMNKVVFQFFSVIGWSLKKLYEIIKKGFKLYEDLQHAIADYIADSKVGEWTEEELRKLHVFLERNHPFFKRAAGVAVAGMLIFIWLNMTFTGNPLYDFDLSDMVAALTGNFTLVEIFGGPEGTRLLMLFATGTLLGLSFPWPGPQNIQFVSAIIFGVARYVGVKIDLPFLNKQNESFDFRRIPHLQRGIRTSDVN